MKRVCLQKSGFERWEEEDFGDDGTYFTCYRVGNVRVSKASDEDNYYIAGRIEDCKLPYEVYSNLPHYKSMHELNWIEKSQLTDEHLYKFYNDCIAYEKEYNEAANNIKYPSLEELKAKQKDINDEIINHYNKIVEGLMVEDLMILSDYERKTFFDYLKSYKNSQVKDSSIDAMKNTAYSINFVKISLIKYSDNSFYYKELLKLRSKMVSQ